MQNRLAVHCLLILAAAICTEVEAGAGDCVKDQYGSVVCGKAQCASDQYGKVLCARDGGDAMPGLALNLAPADP